MAEEQKNPSYRRVPIRWVLVLVVCAMIGIAGFWPSPYVLERPGPVVDALGEIRTESGEQPVIRITGTEVFEPDGELQVLSVTLRGTPENRLSWLAAVPGFVDPTQRLVPIEEVFPPGVDAEGRKAASSAQMQSSQVQATAAALGALGIPFESQVYVTQVTETGAAHNLLLPGDLVLTVNSAPVSSVPEIRSALQNAEEGIAVPVEIERDGEVAVVQITPQVHADGHPMLGVSAAIQVDLPFDVDIEMDRIGGPSAGLTFALATYALLSAEDVLGGLTVSATGTMNIGGEVGPIGGLQQKIWGAARADSDLMFFPLANCADVPAKLPEGIKLVPVETLDESLRVIEEFRSGGSPMGLERCAPGTS